MPDRTAATGISEPDRLTRLGSISVAHFMRAFWQRRPVVLRGVLPGFSPAIDRRQLFAWAHDDQVESRLVTSFNGRWTLDRGPLRRLPARSKRGWSLLVQGVDRLHEEARSVLSRFRFIPDIRLDDIMVSYATEGGGVGAHVDSYDVFLLQAQGRRRWRISDQNDLRLVEGTPLRLVKNFRPTEEWVLDPGDALYLPPGIAHEGTAIHGECMTWSIGFRAPSIQELIEPWFVDFVENQNLGRRYGDRGLAAARHAAALPPKMLDTLHRELSRARPTRRDTERFLLRHGSEPPSSVVFERPNPVLTIAGFRRTAERKGVRLDRRTRMLYSSRGLAVNGEFVATSAAQAQILRRLADARVLDKKSVAAASRASSQHLYDWYCAGWLHCRSAAKLVA